MGPSAQAKGIGLSALLLLASLGLAAPARGAEPAAKVAIIVGPVGEELTPVYIALAEAAAAAAEARGADVTRDLPSGTRLPVFLARLSQAR